MNRAVVADAAACTALLGGVFVAGVLFERLRPLGSKWAHGRIEEMARFIGELPPRVPPLRLAPPRGSADPDLRTRTLGDPL